VKRGGSNEVMEAAVVVQRDDSEEMSKTKSADPGNGEPGTWGRRSGR